MENDFINGSVLKKLILFSLPIFGANILQAMYGTVDLFVVGLFSDSAAVSAVSTGSMTMQTITGIIIGLTMGSTVLLGQNIGRRDMKAATATIASAFVIFVLLGIALAGIIALTAENISSVMNAPKEAFSDTAAYIRICGIGSICIVLFNAIGGIFRGLGDSKTPLVLMGVACVANIVGDLLLVGKFKMGASGAAVATVAAQGISVLFAFLKIKRSGFGFDIIRSAFKPAKREVRMILKFGLPIAAQDALTGVSFMVILAILNGFGLVASAGVGVAEKICALMFLVPSTVVSAVSAFSAQNVGAGEFQRAKKSMIYGMEISFLVGIVVFLISFFRGDIFASLFSKDPDVIAAAADYLRSYSVDCVIVGFNFSMAGYFNGNGKTSFVALQGILSTFLVRIPVSYFMSKIPGVTLFQIGFATPLATVFGIVISAAYLIYFEKHRKSVKI